jgi:hypothetical protein
VHPEVLVDIGCAFQNDVISLVIGLVLIAKALATLCMQLKVSSMRNILTGLLEELNILIENIIKDGHCTRVKTTSFLVLTIHISRRECGLM